MDKNVLDVLKTLERVSNSSDNILQERFREFESLNDAISDARKEEVKWKDAVRRAPNDYMQQRYTVMAETYQLLGKMFSYAKAYPGMPVPPAPACAVETIDDFRWYLKEWDERLTKSLITGRWCRSRTSTLVE